jgi:uncharacterized membrane protein YhaH (DUF805 family)
MGGQTDWAELFFSSTGRLARTPFVIASAGLFAVAYLYLLITPHIVQMLTGWFVYPALLVVGCCLLSKRLHDRGRSGWWAAIVIAALIAVWPLPRSFFDFIFAIIVVWAVVELGLMPGEAGANRFGPSPLRPVST